MHKAARENAVEDIRNLIVTGKYDINEKDAMKRTPLHMASWAGNTEIVKLLLRSKAKTDAIANDNFTALHFATNVEVIKLLVKSNKALIHARVSKGNKTALHIAVTKGNIEIIQCLIDLGSDVTAKTSSGQSCLELAKNDEIYSLIKGIMQSKIDKQQEVMDKRIVITTDEAHQPAELECENEDRVLTATQANNGCDPMEIVRISTSRKVVDDIETEPVIKKNLSYQGNDMNTLSDIECKDETIMEMSAHSDAQKLHVINQMKKSIDPVLGKKTAMTALQRRKKKLKSSGSFQPITLSHLEGEEEEEEQ